MTSMLQHKRDVQWKQEQRRNAISSLPKIFHEPFTPDDTKIHGCSLSQLVDGVHDGSLSRESILVAYGKKAVQAQTSSNCLAEIMIADEYAKSQQSSTTSSGPLAGVPISVKDSENVKGYDSTISFSAWTRKPHAQDSPLVAFLRAAGASIHVKTSVPTTLITCETESELFGRTSNPYNAKYSPGASSGGGGALVAYGGTVIDIGTDLGGSVRCPSHFCGLYTVKGSTGRFLSPSGVSPIVGMEAVNLVAAPIARRLDDLEEMWKRVMSLEPWKVDRNVLAIPWRQVTLRKNVRWGVVWDDGIVPPSPACKRALKMVVDALNDSDGHEVVDFTPPDPFEGICVGAQLIYADGGKQLYSHVRTTEKLEPSCADMRSHLRTPKIFKQAYGLYTKHVRDEPQWGTLLSSMHRKSTSEQWDLVGRREALKTKWYEKWQAEDLDFVLTVPYAIPAIKQGGMKKATAAFGNYVFLFNVLDYSAGVLPVTYVDRALDQLPPSFDMRKLKSLARGAYATYDAHEMHGLPVGIQVVGQRLEEEKVIEGMKVIEDALKKSGGAFEPKVF